MRFWQRFVFEVRSVRHGIFGRGHATNWRVQIIEHAFHQLNGDFGADSAGLITLFDDDAAIGFTH